MLSPLLHVIRTRRTREPLKSTPFPSVRVVYLCVFLRSDERNGDLSASRRSRRQECVSLVVLGVVSFQKSGLSDPLCN